jgi:hypothetical protein
MSRSSAIEQKHEPQDDGEQRAVNFVGVLRERLRRSSPLERVVGRLKSAQEFVQCVQHLLGQLLTDLVLKLAAVFEQGT